MNVAAIVPPSLSVPVVLGVELVGVGIALVLGARWMRRRFPAADPYLILVRTVALIGGVTLIASAFVIDATPESDLANPVQDTVTSVTAGADLFLANCAACHGADAAGGGPDAGTTAVPPANLRSGHLATHSDGDIHYWIGTGLKGGMPAFGERLSDTDRWNLVNYLRFLNGTGPTSSAGAPGADPTPTPTPGLLLSPLAIIGAIVWLVGGLGCRPKGANRIRSLVAPPVAVPAVMPDHLGPHNALEGALWVGGTVLVSVLLWRAYGRSRRD